MRLLACERKVRNMSFSTIAGSQSSDVLGPFALSPKERIVMAKKKATKKKATKKKAKKKKATKKKAAKKK